MHQRSIFPRNINAKMWLPISAIGISFLSAACTPKVSFQSTRWSGSGERPQISAENSEVVSKPTWKSLSEDVQLSEQIVAGFPVDESFVKTIRKNDEYIFQSAGLVPKMSTRLIERAKLLNAQKTEIWQSFLKTRREFQAWKIESQPRVLFMKSQSFQPVIQTVLSSPNGEFFAVSVRENGELISSIQQGSNLTTTLDIQALAFPEGPRRSSLAKIFLSRLNQAEGLANSKIEVATQSPVKILSDQDLEVPRPQHGGIMKTAFAILVSIIALNFNAMANGTPASKDVVIAVNDVYVPGGFDSTADAYVVVSGIFPNGCYKWKGSEVKDVTPFEHEITSTGAVSQGMCLMVLVPFSKDVRLGKLSAGKHTLRFLSGDGTYLEKTLAIE